MESLILIMFQRELEQDTQLEISIGDSFSILNTVHINLTSEWDDYATVQE